MTPKLTATIVICIYIISLSSASPMYVVNRLGMKFSLLRNRTVFGLLFTEDRENVEKISYVINSLSVPCAAFIVIVACTITLSMGLKKAVEWRNKLSQGNCNRVNNRNQKVSRMIVMISTIFIVCFIPINISMLAIAFEPAFGFGGRYFNIVIVFSGLSLTLESVNASANIFIYYHMSGKYRKTFLEIFCTRRNKFGLL